jgi:hypothetical protein
LKDNCRIGDKNEAAGSADAAARSKREGLCGSGIAVVRGLEELGDVSKDVLHGFFAWYCGSHVSLIGMQVHRESGWISSRKPPSAFSEKLSSFRARNGPPSSTRSALAIPGCGK